GAATFALGAVVLHDVHHLAVAGLIGVAFLIGVTATARFAGIAFAVPMGMAGMLALDWFYLPPVHDFELPDSANLVDVIASLCVAVLLGELAAIATRRAQAAE